MTPSGNGTRDLPICSAVPQPTAPPCDPFNIILPFIPKFSKLSSPFEVFKTVFSLRSFQNCLLSSKFSKLSSPFKVFKTVFSLRSFQNCLLPSKFSKLSSPFKVFKIVFFLRSFKNCLLPSNFSKLSSPFVSLIHACYKIRPPPPILLEHTTLNNTDQE